MSIFGTGNFCTRLWNDEEDDYLSWNHSIVDPKWLQNNLIEQTSVLTGKRHFTLKGDYAEVNIQVNLFKYDVGTDGESSKTMFMNRIYNYYTQQTPLEVMLRSSSNKSIQDSTSTPVKFFITRVELSALTNLNFEDIAYVTLKSETYIDPTKSLV